MVKTYKMSFNVCPMCAMGFHDHHKGHDCKNDIPEGQCSCYHGADDLHGFSEKERLEKTKVYEQSKSCKLKSCEECKFYEKKFGVTPYIWCNLKKQMPFGLIPCDDGGK
jgi:hypothetical protein